MNHECCFASCDNDFRQRKAINNPVACLSAAILSFEFLSIQGVGGVGGVICHDHTYCRKDEKMHHNDYLDRINAFFPL